MSSSAKQQMAHTLMKPTVYHLLHNSPLVLPALIQINPVHFLSSYSFVMNFNIFFISIPRSSKWSVSLIFPHQVRVRTSLPNTPHTPPMSSSFLHHLNIWRGVITIRFLVMQFLLPSCYCSPSNTDKSQKKC
jgi:hypothetical protein